MKLALVFVSFFLLGCVRPWTRPNTTEEQLQRDRYECERAMKEVGGQSFFSSGAWRQRATPKNEHFRRALGLTVQLRSDDAQLGRGRSNRVKFDEKSVCTKPRLFEP